MAQPPAYNPATDFHAIELAQPQFPGQELDAEHQAIKTTTDRIRDNLEIIQRDDGQLANESVGYDQLDPALLTGGIYPLSQWTTGTRYNKDQCVAHDTFIYQCLVAHTAGVFADDLAASKWVQLVDLAVDFPDLSAIEALATNGFLKRTGDGAWEIVAAPLPISEGGTGASDLAGAKTALGLAFATATEVAAGADDTKYLNPENAYSDRDIFPTLADAVAKLAPGRGHFSTAGYADAGDGGGGDYVAVGAPAVVTQKYTQINGQWYAVGGRDGVYTEKHLGVIRSGSSDDTVGMTDLSAAAFADKRPIKITSAAEAINISTGLSVTNPAVADYAGPTIEATHGAGTIQAQDGLPGAMLTFRGTPASWVTPSGVYFRGGGIKGLTLESPGGDANMDFIRAMGWHNCTMENVRCQNGGRHALVMDIDTNYQADPMADPPIPDATACSFWRIYGLWAVRIGGLMFYDPYHLGSPAVTLQMCQALLCWGGGALLNSNFQRLIDTSIAYSGFNDALDTNPSTVIGVEQGTNDVTAPGRMRLDNLELDSNKDYNILMRKLAQSEIRGLRSIGGALPGPTTAHVAFATESTGGVTAFTGNDLDFRLDSADTQIALLMSDGAGGGGINSCTGIRIDNLSYNNNGGGTLTQHSGFTSGGKNRSQNFQLTAVDGTVLVPGRYFSYAQPEARGYFGATNGSTLTQMDFAGFKDALLLDSATGATLWLTDVGSKTCDIATAGPAAGGRDQSAAFASDALVHFFLISTPDGATTAVISSEAGSLNDGPVALPSGYTSWAPLTSVIKNGATNLHAVYVRDRQVQYQGRKQVLTSGVATTETSVSVSSFVPSTAPSYEMEAASQNNTAAANLYSTRIRVITGVEYVVFAMLVQSAGGNGSAGRAFSVPNVGQAFFYLSPDSGIFVDAHVMGYTV